MVIGETSSAETVTIASSSSAMPASRCPLATIAWPEPSGRVERLTDLPIDRYVTIVEGKGRIEG